MRLSCPSCQTDYDVPEAALASRPRLLRCGRCAHQWPYDAGDTVPADPPLLAAHPPVFAAPEEVPGDAALADEPAVSEVKPGPPPAPMLPADLGPPPARSWLPQSRLAEPPPKRSPLRLLVLLVIVLAMIFGLLAHDAIMRVWPASAGFFRALGLAGPFA